ncbi:MAG: GIY-YIG nuclease family protein [Patescibacteria group bacterium]|jgi:excinuclease ABC subunit C
MIPSSIHILNQELPDAPGVYFYYDLHGKLLYIGKATSLKKRVGSYFVKAHNARISDLVLNIARIDYIQTATVIEALVLESNQIRAFQPPYNVLSRDDKSFLYLCITNEDYPKPIFLRGLDLERMGIRPFTKTLSSVAKKKFLAVFGPYISSRSLRIALDLIRRSIPWSLCEYKNGGRQCFDAQIGRCPGVCTGEISKKEYRRIIGQLIKFFEGKKTSVIRQMGRDMRHAAIMKDFETAADLRNKIDALEHVNDVALIMREDDWDIVGKNIVIEGGRLNLFGRIEAYDIAHIGGTSTVASMVVFENGKPNKSAYRKFRIKSFEGVNDVAAMEEVMRRRLNRFRTSPNVWSLPDVFVIDGGEGQTNRVTEVLKEFGVEIPVVGIAKGFDRKQDRFIYDLDDAELCRVVKSHRALFQLARDEAHRFAGVYHRVLRSRNSGI